MLRLGMIGAGAVVQGAHASTLTERGDVQVTAVADPVAENREVLGKILGCSALFDRYERLLDRNDVDAVFICLPHYLHEEAVLAAFDAGKDVILEKPIAMNMEQAGRMVCGGKEKNRRFYVILNERFYPPHRYVKAALDDGRYGRPFLALAHVIGDEFARMNRSDHWKGTWDRAGGGALMDTGTHVVDLVLWWFGKPRKVSCQWGRFMVEPENKADDNVAVTFGYDTLLVDIVVSYSAVPDPWREDKRIYFSDASLHILPGDPEPLLERRNKAPLQPLPVEPMPQYWAGSESAALNHFLDCVMGKAEPEYGPEAACNALEMILLAYRAAKEQRTVAIP